MISHAHTKRSIPPVEYHSPKDGTARAPTNTAVQLYNMSLRLYDTNCYTGGLKKTFMFNYNFMRCRRGRPGVYGNRNTVQLYSCNRERRERTRTREVIQRCCNPATSGPGRDSREVSDATGGSSHIIVYRCSPGASHQPTLHLQLYRMYGWPPGHPAHRESNSMPNQ